MEPTFPLRALASTLAFCAILYALLSTGDRVYGDAPMLVEAINSPRPYYNALYVPLGYVLHQLVGRPLGWDEWTTLRWLSVISAALGCALLACEAGRRVRSGIVFTAWMLISVTAPALVFYASVAEVQGLQFAGASGGLLLALPASRAQGARSGVLLLLGSFLTCACHMLGAFLVPALIVLAWNQRPGQGLSLRTALWAVPPALLAPLAINLAERRILQGLGQDDFSPSLVQLMATLGLQERGLFGFSESANWIACEVILPCGFTLMALIAGCTSREERRLTAASLLALAPVVLVLPQLGIRENGAYVLSSLPPVLLLGAAMLARYEHSLLRHRRLLIFGALLVAAGQLAFAVTELRGQPTRAALIEWTVCAKEEGVSGLVYVSSMVREQALLRAGIDVQTCCPMKLLERIPRRHHPKVVQVLLLDILRTRKQSGNVYVDAELVRGPPQGPPAVQDIVARLQSSPSSLVAVGNGRGFYEVVLP